MKKLENPNVKQLSYLLWPMYVLFPITLVLESTPFWLFMAGDVFFVAFLAVLTYYCIKQKCYGTWGLVGGFVLLWAAIWNFYCYLECVVKPGMQAA